MDGHAAKTKEEKDITEGDKKKIKVRRDCEENYLSIKSNHHKKNHEILSKYSPHTYNF